MPPNDLEAVFFCEEAPEIEYRDGLFFISQRVGGYRFERVMRPHIFLLTLRRAAEAARNHRLGGAAIIPFDRGAEKDAVAEH